MPEFVQTAWSQYIYPFLTSYWFGILLLILLGFTMRRSDSTNPYADLSNSLSRTALDALKDTFEQIGKSLRLDSSDDHAKAISKHLAQLFKDFYAKADSLLRASIENIHVHTQSVIMVFGEDNDTRAWRIAGAIITAVLLGIFLLADVIQIAYSLSETTGFYGITRRFLEANPSLDNLPLSIMISSVGTAATLAFVLVDMLGITQFIPWDNVPLPGNKSIIDRLKPWVIRLLFMTVLVSPLFALARLQAIRFNLPFANDLVSIVPLLAQVLILIPMLGTTAFLSYGVMIVYVLYLVGLGLLRLLLLGIRGTFFLLIGLLSAIEPASTPAVGLFLIVFLGVIIVLGMMAGVILMVADSIFFLVGFVFLALAGVFRWIADLINRLFKIR